MKYITWIELKAFSVKRNILIQFSEDNNKIKVYCIDGVDSVYTLLWKNNYAVGISPSNTADLLDFETNYRNAVTVNIGTQPRNSLGQIVYAKSAYSYSEENGTFVGTGVISCPPNAVTIHDIVVTTELYVNGGKVWIYGPPKLGDWAKFSVVDKDDVLGLFSTYGLSTVNNDVLELRSYVRNSALPPFNSHFNIKMETAAKIVSGLYLRATINNVDASNTFYVSVDYTVFMKD